MKQSVQSRHVSLAFAITVSLAFSFSVIIFAFRFSISERFTHEDQIRSMELSSLLGVSITVIS